MKLIVFKETEDDIININSLPFQPIIGFEITIAVDHYKSEIYKGIFVGRTKYLAIWINKKNAPHVWYPEPLLLEELMIMMKNEYQNSSNNNNVKFYNFTTIKEFLTWLEAKD
jgi:hypothetical protein